MSFYCILVWGKDCTIWLCPFTGMLVWGKNCTVLAMPIYQLLSWGNDFTVLLCTFTCILVWEKDFIVFFMLCRKDFTVLVTPFCWLPVWGKDFIVFYSCILDDRFDIPEDKSTLFTPACRSWIVDFILRRKSFSEDKQKAYSFGTDIHMCSST